MPRLHEIGNIWTTLRQLDVRPLQEQAEQAVILSFVGAAGAGKTSLIQALDTNARENEQTIPTATETDLDVGPSPDADLIILVLDATQADQRREAGLYREWVQAGHKVLVFFNKMDAIRDRAMLVNQRGELGGSKVAFGSALDPDSLANEFVPRVLESLPDRHLSLARHYPLFRFAVAREMISDTSFANATYSIGTGLAEVIPMLDIPFNVADMMILTKNQALMVYKLGLALGLSPRWQDHVTELGGVVGAGFVWRQVARQLIGLIPIWGILPKVAVAYAGTYAIGEGVLYWYRTGNKASAENMRQMYRDALTRGRDVAASLARRATRPGWSRRLLPARNAPVVVTTCSNCGRENPQDARYCAYCGTPIDTRAT